MRKLLVAKDISIAIKNPYQPIVKKASFTVDKGEITVLLGESGSGKTMLTKAICNILNRKNMELLGSCTLDGTNIFEKNRERMPISLVMQNPQASFDPSVKMEKQLVMGLRVLGKLSKQEAREKVIEELKRLNLINYQQIFGSYPDQLSGGMLQRIMIAIALLDKAKLIVADEPTTAIDVINRQVVIDEFIKLKNMGLGVLFITHDIVVAKKVADRVAVMHEGCIVEEGRAEDVLNCPTNDYTKKLIAGSILKREAQV